MPIGHSGSSASDGCPRAIGRRRVNAAPCVRSCLPRSVTRPPSLTAHLDLQNAIHIGHSTGGGEVVPGLARHGESWVSKAVLISSVPPLMVKTEANQRALVVDRRRPREPACCPTPPGRCRPVRHGEGTEDGSRHDNRADRAPSGSHLGPVGRRRGRALPPGWFAFGATN